MLVSLKLWPISPSSVVSPCKFRVVNLCILSSLRTPRKINSLISKKWVLMLCHSQINTFQNIFDFLMKKLVVEEHEGMLSLPLRSACSLVLQFGTVEEHLLRLCEILHNKPAAGTKHGMCVYTIDFEFKLVESCNKQEKQSWLKQSVFLISDLPFLELVKPTLEVRTARRILLVL